MKPITPDEVVVLKTNIIPGYVFEAFNELIAENFHDGQASFRQEEVENRILSKAPVTVKRQDLFDKHWLDVEPCYQENGWKVRYDKPGYNKIGPAVYEFQVDK